MKLLLGRGGITTYMNEVGRSAQNQVNWNFFILFFFYFTCIQLYNSFVFFLLDDEPDDFHLNHNRSTLIIDGEDVRSKPKAIRNQTNVLREYASMTIRYIKECVRPLIPVNFQFNKIDKCYEIREKLNKNTKKG